VIKYITFLCAPWFITTTLYNHAGRGVGTVSEYDLKLSHALKQYTQKPYVSHSQFPDGTTHSVKDVSKSQYAGPQHKASCGNPNENAATDVLERTNGHGQLAACHQAYALAWDHVETTAGTCMMLHQTRDTSGDPH
jgi:hypothetical protein